MASRFAAAAKNVVAQPGKRLLVLTGSLTNIQTNVYPIGAESVAVFVFSESNERSLSSVDTFGLPDLASLHVNLKPKEKVRFVTVVQIHAEGAIKRVAVRRGNGRGTPWVRRPEKYRTDVVHLREWHRPGAES